MAIAETDIPSFKLDTWAIVELFGHRKLAGFVSEIEWAGEKWVRVDVPKPGEPMGSKIWEATPLYQPKAIYGITACTERLARETAAATSAAPVTSWEIEGNRAAANIRGAAGPSRILPLPRVVDAEIEPVSGPGPDPEQETLF